MYINSTFTFTSFTCTLNVIQGQYCDHVKQISYKKRIIVHVLRLLIRCNAKDIMVHNWTQKVFTRCFASQWRHCFCVEAAPRLLLADRPRASVLPSTFQLDSLLRWNPSAVRSRRSPPHSSPRPESPQTNISKLNLFLKLEIIWTGKTKVWTFGTEFIFFHVVDWKAKMLLNTRTKTRLEINATQQKNSTKTWSESLKFL